MVDGQFDTVFQEGAFPLWPDNAEQGAARALDLAAAHGEFVELDFAEVGQLHVRQPSFVNAERGAMAVIEVVD